MGLENNYSVVNDSYSVNGCVVHDSHLIMRVFFLFILHKYIFFGQLQKALELIGRRIFLKNRKLAIRTHLKHMEDNKTDDEMPLDIKILLGHASLTT